MHALSPVCRSGRILVNGLNIGFADWGDSAAEPIVLLHSLSGYRRDWDHLAVDLAKRYRLVAMDMRGFGESDRHPEGRYQPHDLAGDAIALADSLGLRRFSLIGHSLGGRASIALAEHHSDRVERLVLVDVGPEFDAAGQLKLRQRIANTPVFFATYDEAYKHLRPHFAKLDELTFRGWLDGYLHPVDGGLEPKRDPLFNRRFARALAGHNLPQPDLWGLWPKIRCPILILRGALSDLLTPALVQRMLDANSNAQCVEIANAAHNIPADNPTAFMSALVDFFRITSSRKGERREHC